MRQQLACGATAAVAIFIATMVSSMTLGAQPKAETGGLELPRSALVSELIGMRVRTPSGERIGAIEDLVMSSSNAVSAAIVSVGGVLGVGVKRVEVPLERLSLDRDASIVVSLTREDLDAMPPYAAEAHSIVPPAAVRTAATTESPPAAARPDRHAQAEADAEAARTFATDDPRVATGIAESKEAFDGDAASGKAEAK